ncbi:proline dehydrogenase family protein [Polaromonas sp. CT11-55]|uniref:proline dehydrogenase family protein n=1 Tax=Polaromonas sp. CT11-55 TaxID=3243045 RepID=UPI0039A4859C
MSLFNTLMASAVALAPRALVRKISRRYIAGDTVADAIERVAALNAAGFAATVDVLGETTESLPQADATTREYLNVLEAIAREGLRANISVKPTALGLLLDEAHCERKFECLLDAAKAYSIFVRMDMEDASCTQREIDLLLRLKSRGYGNAGLVLQAYLKRTDADIASLLGAHENLRICKGIYVEDREHLVKNAWRDRRAINPHFLRHVASCFDGGTFVGVATHDEELVDEVTALARHRQVPPTAFEFQMLLGVHESLRDRLLKEGYAVRIYVPYGKDWYGYSMRRIKENPRIAGYLLRALLTR